MRDGLSIQGSFRFEYIKQREARSSEWRDGVGTSFDGAASADQSPPPHPAYVVTADAASRHCDDATVVNDCRVLQR
jgi:hypothetical protein